MKPFPIQTLSSGWPLAAAVSATLLLLAGCATGGGRPGAAYGIAAPAPATGRPLSAADRAWVDSTLAALSLREKVGQMVMPWVGGEYVAIDSEMFDSLAAWVEDDRVGGLVVSVGMPFAYAAKINALQQRARVPLLIASDMENGPGMRLAGMYAFPSLLPQGGGTAFPPVMALGATGSDSLACQLGRVLAVEARAVGVNIDFGPVLDVNSNPANPIINTRSFGEDPELVARLGIAYIRGARDGGLLTTGKHFPGHGDTETDSHIDLPIIRADRARLDSVELVPFRRAVDAGIDAIMTAHIAVVGVEGPDAPPATLSHRIMTGILRDDLHFKGLLFTDAMRMGAVVKQYGEEEALVGAVRAGADVLLMPLNTRHAIETVTRAVENGSIAEARIDASVRRILEAKAAAGLNTDRLVDLDSVDLIVGTREHTALAQLIAERSITLARDDRALVPLAAGGRRILSITYAALRDPIAGRAFDGALRDGGADVTSMRADARTTVAEMDSMRTAAKDADAVVVSLYVSPMAAAGSIAADSEFANFVEQLAREGLPVIVVSFGSPYLLTEMPAAPAYLLAWGGQEVCQVAAARALLGIAPITGRMPVSVPPYLEIGAGLDRGAN